MAMMVVRRMVVVMMLTGTLSRSGDVKGAAWRVTGVAITWEAMR